MSVPRTTTSGWHDNRASCCYLRHQRWCNINMYKRRCRQLRTRWSFFTDRIVPTMALDFCWRPPWTVRAFSVSIIAIQHTKHGYNGIFICVWCPPTSFGCAPDLWVPGWCCWYSFLLDARFSIPKLALQWFNYPVFSPPVRSVITQKFSFHSLLLVHNILFCCRRHIRFFFVLTLPSSVSYCIVYQ